MAQADSVPSAIRAPITGASANPSTKHCSAGWLYCIDEASTAGQVLKGTNIAAVSYATAVVLLAWFPWNILLILFLFLWRNKHSRFVALDTVSFARCSVFCRGGSSV